MVDSRDIGNKRFEKSAFGYKIDEVDVYLKELMVEFANLEKEVSSSEKKIEVLADKVREYRRDEEVLKEALMGAQRQAHQVIEESQNVANKIVAEANQKADKILSQTKSQLERERTVLSNIQRAVSDFKAQLLGLYKNHLDLITAMPEVDDAYRSENNQEHQQQQPRQQENQEYNKNTNEEPSGKSTWEEEEYGQGNQQSTESNEQSEYSGYAEHIREEDETMIVDTDINVKKIKNKSPFASSKNTQSPYGELKFGHKK